MGFEYEVISADSVRDLEIPATLASPEIEVATELSLMPVTLPPALMAPRGRFAKK